MRAPSTLQAQGLHSTSPPTLSTAGFPLTPTLPGLDVQVGWLDNAHRDNVSYGYRGFNGVYDFYLHLKDNTARSAMYILPSWQLPALEEVCTLPSLLIKQFKLHVLSLRVMGIVTKNVLRMLALGLRSPSAIPRFLQNFPAVAFKLHCRQFKKATKSNLLAIFTMYFNTIFASFALIVTFTLSANADFITLYTGDQCDANTSGNVKPQICDGSCLSFDSKHSFQVSQTRKWLITYWRYQYFIHELLLDPRKQWPLHQILWWWQLQTSGSGRRLFARVPQC